MPETRKENEHKFTTATLGTDCKISTQKDNITSNADETTVQRKTVLRGDIADVKETLPPGWMGLPLKLRKLITWKKSHQIPIPDRAIVMLYVGKQDGGSIDETIERLAPETKKRIVAIDIERCERTQDMSGNEPYNSLCTAASEGRISQIGGGPMCRTWTVRRLIYKPGGGLPCRGIEWGEPQNRGNKRGLNWGGTPSPQHPICPTTMGHPTDPRWDATLKTGQHS